MAIKVGIAGCSNAIPVNERPEVERLCGVLEEMGYAPVLSPHLFSEKSVYSAWGEARAQALMDFYRDDSIEEIFDISGGDLANEVIPWLDYGVIARSEKRFWGYSDLTCLINAVYARTGKASMLYQARFLIGSDGSGQRERFQNGALERFEYRFLRGEHMEGTVVGGNVRCLLKLAGTPYWPDIRGKILLLEGLGTTVANAAAYVAQLDQMGVLEDAAGILLGTFTRMEQRGDSPTFAEILMRRLPEEKPVAKTQQIGHGADSRAVRIGGYLNLGN